MLLFPIPTVVRTETEDGSFIRIGDEVFSLRRLYGDSKAVTRQELAEEVSLWDSHQHDIFAEGKADELPF